jgi:hypothetical protein
MNISAIYCLNTREILYSRATHDYRESSDKKCAIDGGFDYTRVIGNFEDYISIQLDGDRLLRQILYMDYASEGKLGVKAGGCCGRFQITEDSSKVFYSKLIKDFDKVENKIFPYSIK